MRGTVLVFVTPTTATNPIVATVIQHVHVLAMAATLSINLASHFHTVGMTTTALKIPRRSVLDTSPLIAGIKRMGSLVFVSELQTFWFLSLAERFQILNRKPVPKVFEALY